MSKDSQLLGSHVIASCMAANGIKRIHIFPGGTIVPVLDIVHDWNIEILGWNMKVVKSSRMAVFTKEPLKYVVSASYSAAEKVSKTNKKRVKKIKSNKNIR